MGVGAVTISYGNQRTRRRTRKEQDLTYKIMVEAADTGQPVEKQGDANCSEC